MSESDKKPVTPEELLAGFDDQVELDRIEQETAAMSHEEIVADLRKDGIDPEAVLAKDRAMIERLEAERAEKPARSNVRDIRSARRWPTIAVTAVAIAPLAAGFIIGLGRTGVLPAAYLTPPAPIPTVTGAHPPVSDAAYDRFVGFSECFSGRFESCLHHLDDAKSLEPEGEKRDDVIAARKTAELGLARRRGH